MSEPVRRVSARAAAVVSIAVMCSRLLGLAREVILNALFGAGATLSMFVIAFKIPNLLRDLFAEGALSTAFVTTFSKKIVSEGEESAWKLANKVATLTLVFVSSLTLLGILFAGPLVSVVAEGFAPEERAITAWLTALMFPFILLVSLAALVMGMLNAKNVFGWPAMASSFFNIGSIVGGVSLAWWLDPTFGPRALTGLAIGTLIGGFLQLVIQFPALGRAGFRFRLDFRWNDSGVKTVLHLMAPAVIAASAVQVNVMVNAAFATHCGDGAPVWLNNAFRLMQLPLGIFGVALGTVTLPLISRHAVAGDMNSFRSSLAHGLRLSMLLTLPATAGLILLAEPIVGLLYERGRFVPEMTRQTAGALQFYAVGLACYSSLKVLAPAFYAIDKRRTPMLVSFLAIGTNLFLNWLLTFRLGWGHRGLALSTGLVAVVNFTILYWQMGKHLGGLETRATLATVVRVAVATGVLAVVCWAGNVWGLAGWAHWNFPLRLAGLFGLIAVAGASFLGACILLKVEEVRELRGLVERRLKRTRARG